MSVKFPLTLSRRGPLITVVVIVAVAIAAYLAFVGVWTDKLWFDSVSYSGVFNTLLWTRVALFAAFTAAVGGAVALTIWLAFRTRPNLRRTGASAILDRYRDLLESRFVLAMLIPSLVLGLMAGMAAQLQVVEFLAWFHKASFGATDPYFGMDYSFYVFDMPVFRFLVSTLLSTAAICLIASASVHFAIGNLATGRPKRQSKAGPAGVQLSAIMGVTMAGYGLLTLLDRFGLLLGQGENTLFTGMQYTDAHARMTARLVVAIIAFLIAALFFANVFVKRSVVPVAGVVLMVVASLVVSGIYPALVQSFNVKPNEPDKERQYMQTHIQMTQQAYGIDNVETTEYSAVTQVSPGQLKQDAAALPGIRLIDPAVVAATFDQLQQVRGYYSFPDVLDVDRYTIDGVQTDAVVAARELNINGVPDPNWNNLHTVYTHGYGLVAAYGNKRQTMGEPQWIVGDIPPQGALQEFEPRIYFGEESVQFVIVGREAGQAPIELDTPGGGTNGGEVNNTYAGKGGVPIGDFFTRALYATKFGDINFLLSDRINAASKLLYERQPKTRVAEVAPWLTPDSNIYPAVVDGRVVWIVDCYTTAGTYPNSQMVSLRQATSDTESRVLGAQVDESINYMRNSVKAVVDAADGSVTLYEWDQTDPILKAYEAAFPGTVKAKGEISASLLSHFRYPEDLFKVQREMLTRYHMSNADTWYKQSDLWTVPTDPVKTSTDKEPPYYLSIKWPGDAHPVFSETAVFVPKNRSNLASYLAVNADASSPDYGKLRVLRMSDTQQIDGPNQTFNAINTDNTVAEMLRPFLNQGSAAATYGNLLTLPMGNGLLYVMPVYTTRQGSTGSYPALRFVTVRFGEHVGIGSTLQEALDAVFKGDAGASTGEQPSTTPPTTTTTPSTSAPPTGTPDYAAAADALQRAQAAFDAADAALKNGDLATYQAKVNEAKQALADAAKAMGR